MDIKEALAIESRSNEFERHPWEVARLEIIHKLLQSGTPDIDSRKHTILDLGCGDAFIAQQMAKRYPKSRIVGIDTALDCQMRQAILAKSAALNLEIYPSLEQVSCNKESIDIVLLLDILEHLEDDALFLKNISSSKIIKEDAMFFITVPAFQPLFSSHDSALDHFRRYNHKQLLQVLYSASIKPVQYGYFFLSLLPARFFQKILEEMSIVSPQLKAPVASWSKGGFLSWCLKQILVYDFNVSQFYRKFGILLPGLSCYAIGQKQ